MKKIILLNKKEGETPLEALEVFRLKNESYRNTKITYAGRLDPMASGLLLLLADDEVKNKEKYLNLDKEYEFEVLFGVDTDTHDVLGKIKKYDISHTVEEKNIKENLKFFKGNINQKYPKYSSKNIKKVLAGDEVNDTEREVLVKSLRFLGIKKITPKMLLVKVNRRIKKVEGNFRQDEILKLWQENLGKEKGFFQIAKFKIKCSSGTYVRMVASDLGQRLGTYALAYSIKRTKIGKWRIKE